MSLQSILEGYLAPGTRENYKNGLKHWTTWCQKRGVDATQITGPNILGFLTETNDKLSYPRQSAAIAGLRHALKLEGKLFPADPRIAVVLRAFASRHKERPAKPLRLAVLERITAPLVRSRDPRDLRDRALLLIGWAGAFRVGALLSLTTAGGDFSLTEEGLTLRFHDKLYRREKRSVTIEYWKDRDRCPVTALLTWLAIRPATKPNFLFRAISKANRVLARPLEKASVAYILRKRLTAVDIPPEGYSAHSLRSGFVTEMALRGVSPQVIARRSGHDSMTELFGYMRPQDTEEGFGGLFDPT